MQDSYAVLLDSEGGVREPDSYAGLLDVEGGAGDGEGKLIKQC